MQECWKSFRNFQNLKLCYIAIQAHQDCFVQSGSMKCATDFVADSLSIAMNDLKCCFIIGIRQIVPKLGFMQSAPSIQNCQGLHLNKLPIIAKFAIFQRNEYNGEFVKTVPNCDF